MGQPAWIYARFSTLEQSDGDSLNRQLEGARRFIEGNGWEHNPDRELIDEGKSAFNGSNRIEGSHLFQFEKKAVAGLFEAGVVLVVENTDRLTRAGYEAAFDIIRGFTSRGVTVATWSPPHIYPAGARIDMGQAMRLIVEAEIAHEESAKKSKRLRSSWQARIDRAESGSKNAITGITPGWLAVEIDRIDGETIRTIVPNAHRVAVLNQIYDWYIEGKGLPWIVKQLNARNEPTWGLGKHADGKGWNVSTTHKYLTNRAVLGEFTSKVRAGKDVKVERGLTIPDYYPQVVTTEKFNRVQALRADRNGWGGRNQFNFPNLFTNIARCFHCGGTLKQNGIMKDGYVRSHPNKNGTFRTSTQRGPRSYLRCTNYLRSFNCHNKRSYRYEHLETGVIDVLIHWLLEQREFTPDSKVGRLTSALAEHDRGRDLRQKQLDQLVTNMMEVFSKALAQKASELEQQIEADNEARERLRRELEIAQGAASPSESIAFLNAAKADLTHDDPETRYAARVRINQSLKNLIERMDGDETGFINILVRNGLYLRFDKDGQCVEVTPTAATNVVYVGPDGEIDWHPDRPDDEYEYVKEAL